MLQEIIARSLSVELGYYKHAIGSIHLYDVNTSEAHQFLKEGWQPTNMAMPPMPLGDPWPAIELLLRAESDIRTKGALSISDLSNLDPYWSDLIRLLQVFRYSKDKNKLGTLELRTKMSSSVYNSFIDKRLNGF
jgi:thymidylate synthase